jgi:hypothetical protein
MNYTDELGGVIKRLHGVDSTRVEGVPIKEEFRGKTVWEGIVEVFELHGHPKAKRAYASAYETENPKKPHHVTVLHIGPIMSPLEAARAAIVQELQFPGKTYVNRSRRNDNCRKMLARARRRDRTLCRAGC